ncbi:uracil-DNA glycosylase [Candidatus Saccharibacteria bacterium]|nr:uracil-DNA glycosylase [Candidatus Saccharibacteria bacterium]
MSTSFDFKTLFAEQAGPVWKKHIPMSVLQRTQDRYNNLPKAFRETVYPPPEKLFRAFELTDLDKIQVVFLGQDPYIRVNQAMGLSFSTPKGTPVQPSLRNILNELHCDHSTDLSDWARQGVFLPNASLTVSEGQSNSHKEVWEEFTSVELEKVNDVCDYVIFILCGRSAQALGRAHIDASKHTIIELSHPAPFSVAKPAPIPFKGSQIFKKINTLRMLHELEPIQWAEVHCDQPQ